MYGFRPDARRCRSSFACTLPPVELAKPLLSLPALLLYRQLPCIGVHMALQQFIGNFGHADTPLRDDRSGGHLTHRSVEHPFEHQSQMRISFAVFSLK